MRKFLLAVIALAISTSAAAFTIHNQTSVFDINFIVQDKNGNTVSYNGLSPGYAARTKPYVLTPHTSANYSITLIHHHWWRKDETYYDTFQASTDADITFADRYDSIKDRYVPTRYIH